MFSRNQLSHEFSLFRPPSAHAPYAPPRPGTYHTWSGDNIPYDRHLRRVMHLSPRVGLPQEISSGVTFTGSEYLPRFTTWFGNSDELTPHKHWPHRVSSWGKLGRQWSTSLACWLFAMSCHAMEEALKSLGNTLSSLGLSKLSRFSAST